MRRNDHTAQVNLIDWWQSPDPCLRLPSTELRTITRTVAQHLAEWGGVVHSLQQREAKEWELLRIQIEQALKRFPYDLASKDDYYC